jgi:hypothetical protein
MKKEWCQSSALQLGQQVSLFVSYLRPSKQVMRVSPRSSIKSPDSCPDPSLRLEVKQSKFKNDELPEDTDFELDFSQALRFSSRSSSRSRFQQEDKWSI